MAQRTLVVPSVQENNDAVEIKIPRPNRWVQNHLAEEQLNEFSSSQDVENINTTRMNNGWFEGEKEQNFESFSSDELTNRLILAQLEESNQEEEINEKRHNKFINKNPQRKKELKIRKEKSVQILENSEVEIAKLKMMVWEDLIKNRTQTAPNIELHNAPRTTQDYITELIQKQVGNAAFNFVDLGVVVDKFLLWKRKLPRAEPFYAIKSNPDKEIANVLNILGAGFDCASKAEISQCLDMGVSPDRIIFANPCKAVDHLVYARETGVKMMTFDNMDELNKIQKHFPEAHLVLRLLPDDSYSLMPFGIKFGATMEDATKLMQACKERAMTLIGVSFHVGSGCLSSVAYVEAVKLARRAFDEAAKFGIEMTFLDLGGGWPGHENGDLKFGDIGAKITPVIDQLFPENVRVIGEPGRFICTETTTLACHIVGKRERTISGVAQEPEKETQYYINDGVYGSFNCIMFDHANPTPSFLGSNGERPLTKSTIFGPTCDSMDVICKKTYLPEHFVGEWIYFCNMGAYTTSAASSFNGFAPPRSVYIIEATSKS